MSIYARCCGKDHALSKRKCVVCGKRFHRYIVKVKDSVSGNPVRAEMVEHPKDYRWSSYRTNAQGESTVVLSPHPVYLDLGRTEDERHAVYRELFRCHLEPGIIDNIRKATNGNFVLGNNRFQNEISQALGRRVKPGLAGRPRKQKD